MAEVKKKRKALKKLGKSEELWKTIRLTATKGGEELDSENLKKIKKICRNSDDNVEDAFNAIFYNLCEDHSEVRFTAFLLLEYLFQRSAHFKKLLLNNLGDFFWLCLGAVLDQGEESSQKKRPLPLPKEKAEELQRRATGFFLKWKDSVGQGVHPELDLGYKFVLRCERVNFKELEDNFRQGEERRAESERRANAIKRRKVEQIVEELADVGEDIENCLNQLNSCLQILVPTLENFDHDVDQPEAFQNGFEAAVFEDDDEDGYSAPVSSLREHGIISNDLDMVVTVGGQEKLVEESEENSAVIENAKDQCRLLIRRWLPRVIRWNEAISRFGDAEDAALAERIKNLKVSTEAAIKKYNDLELPCALSSSRPRRVHDENDDDEEGSESDWESVGDEKDGYEDFAVAPPVPTRPSTSTVDPGVAAVDINAPGPSGIQELLKRRLSQKKRDSEDEEEPNPGPNRANATSRRTEGGEFQPVTHTCKAPLPSGRLCPRQDRIKCPFHGVIIPRDDQGKPLYQSLEDISDEDEANEDGDIGRGRKRELEECEDEVEPVPDWQDPELLRRLKEETGVDLKMPDRRRKKKRTGEDQEASGSNGRRRRFPNLTDISLMLKHNTARMRLKKKLMSKSAMRRLAAKLDGFDTTTHSTARQVPGVVRRCQAKKR